MPAAPPITRTPAPSRAATETSGTANDSGTKASAAVPPTIKAQARALAANSRPSGTGTDRRIQNARRSACMCASGPMVAMYNASE